MSDEANAVLPFCIGFVAGAACMTAVAVVIVYVVVRRISEGNGQ